MAITVHIYPLSRLVNATPADWEKELEKIESGKGFANRYYQPVRDGIVSFCKGKGKDYEETVRRIEDDARDVRVAKGDPLRDNKAAFEVFFNKFYPRIGRFQKGLLATDGRGGCQFSGVELLGAPHFIATDNKGADRYVFVLPGQRDKNEVKAYVELLAVIIEHRFGASPDAIWCMDLKNGKDLAWRPSPRVRKQCEKTASLYARLIRTISQG